MPEFKYTLAAKKERALKVYRILHKTYPDAGCTLDHSQALELLISTILAAQCTDARVNIVTKDLFKKYRNARDYANAPDAELEDAIRTCGFYRQKTKSIKKTCQAILDKFGGKVPGTMEELTQLEGVGRKTANVILGTCFNTPGVIVDTHCTRLANRLGLTKHSEPAKIEQDLMNVLPKDKWTLFSHLMVHHGRAICVARGPRCSICPVFDHCPFPHSREGRKVAK